MNLLPATYNGNGAAKIGGAALHVNGPGIDAGSVQLGVRPENIGVSSVPNDLPFKLDLIEELGASRLLHGSLESLPFIVHLGNEVPVPEGDIFLDIAPEAVHLFSENGGQRL